MSNFKSAFKKAFDSPLLVRLIIAAGALICFAVFFVTGPMSVLDGGGFVDFAVILTVCELILLALAVIFDRVLPIRSNTVFASVIIIAAAALALRLYYFNAASGDYNSFLSVWIEEMRSLPGTQPIVKSIGDYNMPYLYFLFLVSRTPIYDLYAIKLLSVVFDFVLAAGATAIIYKCKKSDFYSLICFTATLFVPTVFLNSAYWGQCDSIYAALCVLALCFAMHKKSATSMVFFALAFSFKIQTVFILPIVVILVLRRKIKLRDLLFFPATFIATLIPAMLCGRSFYDTFSIYLKQTESYPALTLNCPTFWALFPDNEFETFGTAALFLAGAVCLVFMVYLYKNRKSLNDTLLFDAAFIFVLIMPFFLPRMHERYFYLAEILSVIYAFIHNKRFFPLFIILSSFNCYCVYLFGYQISQFEYFAVLNLAIIIYVAKKFADDVCAAKVCDKSAVACEKEPT